MNAQGRQNREERIFSVMRRFHGRYRDANQWLILVNNSLTTMFKVRNSNVLTSILKGLKGKGLVLKRNNTYCCRKESNGAMQSNCWDTGITAPLSIAY